MNDQPAPRLPLPPPLRGADAGTFAETTVKERLPRIVQHTLENNAFPPVVAQALQTLYHEIPDSRIRPLQGRAAGDGWDGYVAPYLQDNWLTAPWLFVEFYLYRRILEATGYFEQPEPVDPFAAQKWRGLAEENAGIQVLCQTAADLPTPAAFWARLPALAAQSLWGNRADLSMWPGGAAEQPDHEASVAHILVNDLPAVTAYLQTHPIPVPALTLVLDNAGLELVADLALADALLAAGVTRRLTLHVKDHPTFVSDATPGDVQTMLAFLMQLGGAAAATSTRLQTAQQQGRLVVRAPSFWTAPLAFWEMPASLRHALATHTFLFIKGDANYRRLLGDRHWPYDTPFADIVGYMPASFLSLRTLKAEVAAGIPPQTLAEVRRRDPRWLISGRWGLLQAWLSDP